MDDGLTDERHRPGLSASPNTRRNMETPGSVIDRMSVLALRIDHLEEEAAESLATTEHLEKVQGELSHCLEQLDDLSRALGELLEDSFADQRWPETSRHLKLYNNLELNPYLYRARKRKAG